jgi:hypothetical protein
MSTRILLSTYTDPNGIERTLVFRGNSIRFSRKRQDKQTIETAKRIARNAYDELAFGGRLVWWDGDIGSKHVVAEKE